MSSIKSIIHPALDVCTSMLNALNQDSHTPTKANKVYYILCALSCVGFALIARFIFKASWGASILSSPIGMFFVIRKKDSLLRIFQIMLREKKELNLDPFALKAHCDKIISQISKVDPSVDPNDKPSQLVLEIFSIQEIKNQLSNQSKELMNFSKILGSRDDLAQCASQANRVAQSCISLINSRQRQSTSFLSSGTNTQLNSGSNAVKFTVASEDFYLSQKDEQEIFSLLNDKEKLLYCLRAMGAYQDNYYFSSCLPQAQKKYPLTISLSSCSYVIDKLLKECDDMLEREKVVKTFVELVASQPKDKLNFKPSECDKIVDYLSKFSFLDSASDLFVKLKQASGTTVVSDSVTWKLSNKENILQQTQSHTLSAFCDKLSLIETNPSVKSVNAKIHTLLAKISHLSSLRPLNTQASFALSNINSSDIPKLDQLLSDNAVLKNPEISKNIINSVELIATRLENIALELELERVKDSRVEVQYQKMQKN